MVPAPADDAHDIVFKEVALEAEGLGFDELAALGIAVEEARDGERFGDHLLAGEVEEADVVGIAGLRDACVDDIGDTNVVEGIGGEHGGPEVLEDDGCGAEIAAVGGLKDIGVEIARRAGPAGGVVEGGGVVALAGVEAGEDVVAEREAEEFFSAVLEIETVESRGAKRLAQAHRGAIRDTLLVDEGAADIGVGLVVGKILRDVDCDAAAGGTAAVVAEGEGQQAGGARALLVVGELDAAAAAEEFLSEGEVADLENLVDVVQAAAQEPVAVVEDIRVLQRLGDETGGDDAAAVKRVDGIAAVRILRVADSAHNAGEVGERGIGGAGEARALLSWSVEYDGDLNEIGHADAGRGGDDGGGVEPVVDRDFGAIGVSG